MESSLKDETEAGGSLLNHAKAEALRVMEKVLHLTGSFIPSKASIYSILNFVGRGKCSTSVMNRDSVCCTRVSMETGARTFTISFMWLSSCWISWNHCS